MYTSCHFPLFFNKNGGGVDGEVTSATNLVNKKNAKNIMWNYFGLKADRNVIVLKKYANCPACCTCNKSALCKGFNTNNLFSHEIIDPTQFE